MIVAKVSGSVSLITAIGCCFSFIREVNSQLRFNGDISHVLEHTTRVYQSSQAWIFLPSECCNREGWLVAEEHCLLESGTVVHVSYLGSRVFGYAFLLGLHNRRKFIVPLLGLQEHEEGVNKS